MIAHYEDKNEIALSKLSRDYGELKGLVVSDINEYTFKVNNCDEIYAFKINNVKQLTRIYGFNVFAVTFYASSLVGTISDEELTIFDKLVNELEKEISKKTGYYILKIPSHLLSLIDRVNKILNKNIFSGGTVCYSISKKINQLEIYDDMTIFTADSEFKLKNRERLIEISSKSFEDYYGQYHISYITRGKAKYVYSNWIEEDLCPESSTKIDVAVCNGQIVGFMSYKYKKGNYAEIILSAVDSSFRGMKVYERLVRNCTINMMESKNCKLVTISTQIDNYNVQSAWCNIGFKPYYTFYNVHIDNR